MKCLLIINWRCIQSVPTRKKSKVLKSGEPRLYLEHCLRTCIDMNFCLRFGVGNALLKSGEAVLVQSVFCVLCYTCIRKVRDVLGAGEVLGHTHDWQEYVVSVMLISVLKM